MASCASHKIWNHIPARAKDFSRFRFLIPVACMIPAVLWVLPVQKKSFVLFPVLHLLFWLLNTSSPPVSETHLTLALGWAAGFFALFGQKSQWRHLAAFHIVILILALSY